MSVGRCHSAFQHYEMFHGHGACHGGGNNYGSIFNITYNCSGRHGNFWSGLATGLGYGIGNWFMGGLNMLGGWLGLGGMGFGGGWGMGMGMPTFGWGGGAGRVGDDSDYGRYRRSDSSERTVVRTEVKYKDDIDHEAINKLSGEVKALAEKAKSGNVTPEEVAALNKKLDDAKNASDENAKPLDQGTYENLKGILSTIKTTPAAQPPVDTQNIERSVPDDWANIPNLTEDDKNTLKGLGVKPIQIDGKNGKIWALSLPSDLTADNLTKLKGIADGKNIPVAVAHNPSAGLDKWIAGKIDNIEANNGKLSYTVDCSNVGHLEYKHTIQQVDGNKYKVDRHADSEAKAKKDGFSHKAQDYEFSNGLLRRNGESVNQKI